MNNVLLNTHKNTNCRPNNYFSQQPTSLLLLQGDVISEAVLTFSNYTSVTLRLYNNLPYIESEWTVGPIPVDNGIGKEITLKYKSNTIESGDTCYTDANGREMMERRRDFREYWDLDTEKEPVASNFYPVTGVILIRDSSDGGRQGRKDGEKGDDVELAVINDRAQCKFLVMDFWLFLACILFCFGIIV